MSVEVLQEKLPYPQWKQMMIDIKKSRRKQPSKRLKKKKNKHKETSDEFDDPGFTKILEEVPSIEFLPPAEPLKTSLQKRASHPSTEGKLSNNPNANDDAEMGEESEGP